MGIQVETIADGITLYCGDCREILPTLSRFDAVVTDPPYGIGRDKGNGGFGGFGEPIARRQYADDWDYKPDASLLRQIIDISENTIIWGGNFFTATLPENGHWLVWDKQNTMPKFSDCELAWTNIAKTSVKIFRYSNNGLMAREKNRVHPTQKPIELMRWCIGDFKSILDPFMGSGSTGVAAVKLGRKFTGIEIEPKYYDIARKRITDALKQPDLFVEPPKPVQLTWDQMWNKPFDKPELVWGDKS